MGDRSRSIALEINMMQVRPFRRGSVVKVKSEVVFVAIRYCRCAGVRWRKVLRVLTCYFLFGSARPEVSIAMPGRVMVPPF